MGSTKNYRIPKRRLFSVPVPPETRTYKPISYKELAKTTLKAIKAAGFRISREEYTAARQGLNATARYTIDMGDPEMALEIAWQNSYDKRLTVKFAIGTRVFICDNGCVTGDFGAFKRKHTGDVRDFTLDDITTIVEKSGSIFGRMVVERDIMKEIPCASDFKAVIVGRLFLEKDIISTHLLLDIKEQILNPSHDYGAPETLWETYQHITYAMKNLHPTLWMENHIEIHDFFMDYVKDYVYYSAPALPPHLKDNIYTKDIGNEREDELREEREATEKSLELSAPEEIEVVDPQQIDLEDMIAEVEGETMDPDGEMDIQLEDDD